MKYFFIFIFSLCSFSAYSHFPPSYLDSYTYSSKVDPTRFVYKANDFTLEGAVVFKTSEYLFFTNYFLHYHYYFERNGSRHSEVLEISESEYDLLVNTDKPVIIKPYDAFGRRVMEIRGALY